MVAFYNPGDQKIYENFQYVPQEKYRLGFTAPTTTPTAAPVSGGITNTNAFTNSGGGGGIGGNAFGYGSPVSEVNVRTFNPQSNDPTGSVANAQTMYNKASNAGPMVETFTGMRPSESVMDYYGGQIMDNREQYGAQGQYNSPYDDTVDQSKYTKTIGSFPSRGFFNRMRNKGFNLMENIPYIGLPTRIIKSILPEQEDRGPGGGTYGAAGLSDAQKEAYNTLARDGMLFDGSSGLKTLTGKNFTGKGYMEGQREIYDREFADMTDEEIEALKNDPRQRFKYKQFQESSALFKEKIAAADKAYKEKQAADAITAAANTKNPDGSTAAYNYAGRDNEFGTHTSTISNEKAQENQDRGRGKYFFGGRVNFKDGGLASIL